jgi:hypothetical protein
MAEANGPSPARVLTHFAGRLLVATPTALVTGDCQGNESRYIQARRWLRRRNLICKH